MESMRSKTSGAGLGWREAQRLPSLKLWQRQAGAWGRQRSPQKAKKRREFAGLFGHGDNGGTIGDADNAARFAVKADDIASAETEWRKGFHLEF